MIVSKIGRRGQLTLPRSVRETLGLEEGNHVAFVRKGDEIVLQPLTQTLLDLRGVIRVSGPQDFEAIRRRAAKAVGRKAAGGEG